VAAATRNGDSDANRVRLRGCGVLSTSLSWRVSIWFTVKLSIRTAQQAVNVADQLLKILSMRESEIRVCAPDFIEHPLSDWPAILSDL
jgi:hypothetical protein